MNFKLFAALILLSSCVVGCGIKGALYMPAPDESVSAVEEETAKDNRSDKASAVKKEEQESNTAATVDESLTDADKVSSALNSSNVGDKASATTR